MPMLLWRFLFAAVKDKVPTKPLPSVKNDLHALNPDENCLVWMGHSSYFLQVDGRRFLVDPVFSGRASPVPGTTQAFAGADVYGVEDIPDLDALVITHDHWDHLDYPTVTRLWKRTARVVTGLGTGEHLEYWGCPADKLVELDWEESAQIFPGFRVSAETARHFSGRGLVRNQALWISLVLESPSQKIFLGGDSGYGSHFKKIGDKYGGFDLAILENGQYNTDWRYIHMMPGEQLRAMRDLEARTLLPVHHSKFALALHSWKEPLQHLNKDTDWNLRILTPVIGQKVGWQGDSPAFPAWWEDLPS